MNIKPSTLICLSLPSLGLATIVTSAVASEDKPKGSNWANPMYLTATVPSDRFTISAGQVYSSFKGRRLESQQLTLTAVPSDKLLLWYGYQKNTVKGRSATSRLHAGATSLGLRWLYGTPKTMTDPTWALQIEKVLPTKATSVTSGGTEIFNPTRNLALTVIRTTTKSSYSAGYANVRGAASGNADVLTLGYAAEHGDEDEGLFTQAQLIGQRWTGPATSGVLEVKALFTACYRVPISGHLGAEFEGSFYPLGLPMASGSVTGLSSFLIYEPGGAAEGLRKDPVGFLCARLMWKQKF